jgi:NO-binding membrane sensor protein with MHYT domain/two-component sensor histidine kinase
MTGSYDYRLVAVSVLIAICAAYVALDLAGRITAARGRLRLAWLAGGAIAMGLGIWSMHYIGMLAFDLPVPVLYDWPTVLLSLLAAVFASLVALFVVSRPKLDLPRAVVGGAIMGSGIATMHYTGMAAMRLPATYTYRPSLLILSVVLAIVISMVAIWLTFRLREEDQASAGRKIACAAMMGAAIPVMHYTGMAAARFTPSPMFPDTAHAVSTSTLGFAGVSGVTLLVFGVAVLTAAVDRRFSAQKLQSEETVRDLSGRLLQMQDEERRHFARELHDVVGQTISALGMNLTCLKTEIEMTARATDLVNESTDLVAELSKEVRTISYLLHPPLLDELGLSAAIRDYVEGFAERSRVHVDLEIPADFGRLSREVETVIFRVVQECLTNIHRHSGSTVAQIRISHDESGVRVDVRDKGKGMSLQKRSEMELTGKAGVGIRGMRERLRQLGGTLQISSGQNGPGTAVEARLPTAKRT